jgi:hypothetical protein
MDSNMRSAQTSKTVRKNFNLPIEIVNDVQEISKESGISFTELVNQALANVIEAYKKKQLEALIEEDCLLYGEIAKNLAREWAVTEPKVE